MENKKQKKEIKSSNKEWVIYAIVLVLAAGSFWAYQQAEDKQILAECLDIEYQIATNPDFQRGNVTCNCFPGSKYFDEISAQTDEQVVKKADLKYVVACNIADQIKLYPVWKTK